MNNKKLVEQIKQRLKQACSDALQGGIVAPPDPQGLGGGNDVCIALPLPCLRQERLVGQPPTGEADAPYGLEQLLGNEIKVQFLTSYW